MTSVNSRTAITGLTGPQPRNPLGGPETPGQDPALASDSLKVAPGARHAGADPLASYPVGQGATPQVDLGATGQVDRQIAEMKAQAENELAAMAKADQKITGGNVVARGFNHFVNFFSHREDTLGLASAKAQTALTHDMNAALATYHAEALANNPLAEAHLKASLASVKAAVAAHDQALGKLATGNKFWSGIAADVVAGVTVVAGIALTATGVGAPIGVPLLAAGAFVVGGGVALGAHSVIDNQFDLKHEGLQTFAVGGVGGIAAALTGGASEALTAGITGQAARIVGQEAIQGAGARFVIGAAANSVVGAGFGGATSGVQAIAAGEDLSGVLKATALGAAGGAVGGVAAHGLGSAMGAGAKAAQRAVAGQEGVLANTVNAAVGATESTAGRAFSTLAKGVVTGAGAGGAGGALNAIASGKPIDFESLRDQILAGAIQGGALSSAGLAGKALPQRSVVKAPPTIEETYKTLKALAPRGNSALAETQGQLVENYRASQRRAIAQMNELRVAEKALAGETDPAKRAATLQQQVANFDRAMLELDGARGALVGFAKANMSPAASKQVIAAVGEPNSAVGYGRSLDSPTGIKHNEAVVAFLTKFSNLGLEGIAEPNVKGLSPRAMQAVSESLNMEASSSDAKGAANVEHLSTVLKGVLETAAREKGAPLTQQEVDARAAVTVMTDAWMKGATPEALAKVGTAQTNAGATGGDIWRQLVTRAMNVPKGQQIPPQIEGTIKQWLESFGSPTDRTAVVETFTAKGLSAKDAGVWADRFMARDKVITNPMLLGTWTHGVPQFGAIEGVVKSMGGDHAMAQAYYEEVLAHHASGFVMNGFARGGLNVDFFKMAREGALTPVAAQRLTNLYGSAIPLAGKWRPVIDTVTSGKPLNVEAYEAFRKTVGLKPLTAQERTAYAGLNNGAGRPVNPQELAAFRRAYGAAAADYRNAVAQLTPNSRSQLLNDDRMQFTEVGMPKWLNMQMFMAKPKTMGELAEVVYKGPVQGYAEENYARGADVGKAFDQTAAPIASRLGMAFDPATRTYHAAHAGEPAFEDFAQRIAADPEYGPAIAKNGWGAGDAEKIVDWFREQPPKPEALTRLVQAAAVPEA